MRIRIGLCVLLPLTIMFLTPLIVFSPTTTLSPLQNANVNVSGDNGSGYVSTGPDGIFKPLELAEGNYTVEIRHEGYVSRTFNTTVTAGSETDLGDIELKTSGKIQGAVRDPDGYPAPNINVQCIDESTDNAVGWTTTSSGGSFSFNTDIQNGTYALLATLSIGYPPVPGLAGWASSMVTGIGASEGQTSNANLQLRPSGTILGTVKDESSAPIPNVNVFVNEQDDSGTYSGGFSMTDSLGEYVIDRNLPAGNYTVYVADAKGFVYSYDDFVNATVTAGQNTTVNFVLSHSGIISGIVNLMGGDPAPNIMVSAASTDFKYFGSAQTDNVGLYRIDSGLGTGQYMVTAANDYVNTKTANVTEGMETPNVDFQIIRNSAWINGTILNSTGGPIGWGAGVEAVGEGIFPTRAYAGFDGKYSVEIQLPDFLNSTQVSLAASAKGFFTSSQNVTVNKGQTTSPVDFTLQMMPFGTLTGRVIAAAPSTTLRTVGVSVGNTFNYTAAFSWNSSDPNATLPSYFASLSDMEWASSSIVGVSGTSVTLNVTMHFKNGTDLTNVGLTDIDTGVGNITYWVLGADLNQNDTVYTSAMYSSQVINETLVRAYPGGARNTTHLNMETVTNMNGMYQHYSSNYYWDRSTGAMVEMSMAMSTQTNTSQMNVSTTLKIVESNMWIVPEFPTTSIPVILVLLTAIIVLGKKRLTRARAASECM